MSGFEGKRILVTGGAGFLGGPLIRSLVERRARPEDVAVPEYPRFDLRRPADCAESGPPRNPAPPVTRILFPSNPLIP